MTQSISHGGARNIEEGGSVEAMELLLSKMGKTKNNEFLSSMAAGLPLRGRGIVVTASTRLVLLLCASIISCATVRAQTARPVHLTESRPAPGRLGLEVAAGPAYEVATAGDRASQRAALGVATLAVRVASWFEYTFEGHVSRHVTPVQGNVFGIVPLGFRVHTKARTQLYLSAGAGLVWTDLAGLHGVEQRRNFLTQIGTGIARVGARGSGVSLEARFFHLSNLNAAPPNLGMEAFAVLVGYRLPR